MTTLKLLTERPVVHALGWCLLHFLWQGTLIAILLACVLALLHGGSPQLRYAIACGAFVLMIVLPVVTFGRLAAMQQRAEGSITSSRSDRASVLSLQDGLSGVTAPLLDRMSAVLDQSAPWVSGAWFAGVLLFLGRLNLGLVVTRRMKSVATQPASVELQVLLHRLSQRLGVERSVRLLSSTLVQVPTVIGWVRPVILIPVGAMMGLSVVQVEAILAHELAHVRRHDYLVSVFQSVVEALLFYHPAVWWVSKQMRQEREHCCDDLAVAIGGDSLAYAKALSLLEEKRRSEPMVALGADGGVLIMRIRRLLGLKETPAVSRMLATTVLAVAIATAGLWTMGAARAQSNIAKQPTTEYGQGSQKLAGPYQQWLDEDVRWVITPEERAAYLQLASDAERDQYIKQFWLRRDLPEAPEDSYRTEHYRRLAYANVHFAAGMPGWKTDRGRIYIVDGPPDAIDTHPSGNAGSARAFEVWHYRLIQEAGSPEQGTPGDKATVVTRKDVDLKFVDVCSCGDYQLQPAP